MVDHCRFIENETAGLGGGLNSALGPVLNTIFVRNVAGVFGGGANANTFSNGNFTNCIFEDNSAKRGGGVYTRFNEYMNCVFFRNTATESSSDASGGAAFLSGIGSSAPDQHPKFTNCTFVVNQSAVGGPIGFVTNLTGAYSVFTNCLFWGGANGPFPQNSTVTYSFVDWEGTGNIRSGSPEFSTLHGRFHFRHGSPCIDAGDNSVVPGDISVDLDGNPRFVDDPNTPDTGNGAAPIVDIGAYEHGGGPVLTESADLNFDGKVDLLDYYLFQQTFMAIGGPK